MKRGLSHRLWNYERVKFLEANQDFIEESLRGVEGHKDYVRNPSALNFLIVIRKQFGYSPKTYDGDILWTWLQLWKEFKIKKKQEEKK